MELLNKINQTREKMIFAGRTLGLTDSKTVALSQELDKLIIKAQEKGMAI